MNPSGSLIRRLSGFVPAFALGTNLTAVPDSRSCGLGLPRTPPVLRVNRVARAERPAPGSGASTLSTAANTGRVLVPITAPSIPELISAIDVAI